MMRSTRTELFEFISRDISGHQTHFEDLVLLGQNGLEELNDKIEKYIKSNQLSGRTLNISCKLDGAPAVAIYHSFPGYPKDSIQLKSFIQGPDSAMSSEEEILDRYGDRPDMADKLISCLKLAPYIPDNEAWWGDCLFGTSDKKKETIRGTEYITFHPNKIVYAFSEDNPGYEKVERAIFGICFHTKFTPNGDKKKVTYDLDASNYNFPDWAYIMSPELPIDSTADMGQLQTWYTTLLEYEKELTATPEYETLINNEVFMTYWNMFENRELADKKQTQIDVYSFTDDLWDFIEEKRTKEFSTKMSALKTNKGKIKAISDWASSIEELKELLTSNKRILKLMVMTLNMASTIKMAIWEQLKNSKLGYSTFYKSKTKGILDATMEGIAMSDMDGNIVKIVDRSTFSSANRDPDILAGWEHPEDAVTESVRSKKRTYESADDSISSPVVFAWGRMNPPTRGHLKLIKTMNKLATEYSCPAKLYLSHSQDSDKNPIPYDHKIDYATIAFSDYVDVVPSEARTVIFALHELYEQGFTDLIYVGGEDRIGGEGDVSGMISKYNGVPVKNEKMYYKFNTVTFENAGHRDAESEDPDEMASASYVRSLAADGEWNEFCTMVPFDVEMAQALFRELRQNMKLEEALKRGGALKFDVNGNHTKYIQPFIDRLDDPEGIELVDTEDRWVPTEDVKAELRRLAKNPTTFDEESSKVFNRVLGKKRAILKSPFSGQGGDKGGNDGNKFEVVITNLINNPDEYPDLMDLYIALEDMIGEPIISAEQLGGLNQKRPAVLRDGYLYVAKDKTGQADRIQDIGSTVVDVAVTTESGKQIYLSCKYGPRVDITGPGTKGPNLLPDDVIRSGEVTTPDGLSMLGLFNLDPVEFCKPFTSAEQDIPYRGFSEDALTDPTTKDKISALLQSAFGYGYIFVHGFAKGTIELTNFLEPIYCEELFGPDAIVSSENSYGGYDLHSNRVNNKTLLSNGMRIESIFRKKSPQGAKGLPTHLCIGYSKLPVDTEVRVPTLSSYIERAR